MEELNKLYELRKKIELKLEQLGEELDVLDYDDDEYSSVLDMTEELEEEIYKIDEAIIMTKNPDASNDKIDLKKNIHKGGKFGEYYILLHGTNTKVGQIGFYSKESVGGLIYEEYRGNHYLYEALNLLSQILYNNGIECFYPIIHKDNIASIKLVERYGGRLIKELDGGLVQYECKTNPKELEEETNKKI